MLAPALCCCDMKVARALYIAHVMRPYALVY
jgi:hypothetical protein